jgi:hypothetical protein
MNIRGFDLIDSPCLLIHPANGQPPAIAGAIAWTLISTLKTGREGLADVLQRLFQPKTGAVQRGAVFHGGLDIDHREHS